MKVIIKQAHNVMRVTKFMPFLFDLHWVSEAILSALHKKSVPVLTLSAVFGTYVAPRWHGGIM